jgi:uncharacterized membrane protein
VALLGLFLYVGMVALAMVRLRFGDASPWLVTLGLFGLAFAGALYSGYLTYLEFFLIGALCPWCVASALILACLLVLTAWDLAATMSNA